jgi:hypothetical protein
MPREKTDVHWLDVSVMDDPLRNLAVDPDIVRLNEIAALRWIARMLVDKVRAGLP